MNTPISDAIAELYRRAPEKQFHEDFAYYVEHGYVFIGPDHILMGKETDDGWFVYLAVGKDCLSKFVKYMPHWRSKIGWSKEHRGRVTVTWYNTADILRLVGVDYEDQT